jgi:AraC-like DNA-binding protein
MSSRRLQPNAESSFLSRQVREHRYFFLNAAPSARADLAVVCGGWERCAPDYRIDRSKFAFSGIEYVTGGRGLLVLNGVEHKLSPGSVFAYGPSTAHIILSSPDEPLVKYFIDFSGPAARRIIGRKVLGARSVAYVPHAQPIHNLFEQMVETGSRGGALAPRLCVLLLELLSLRIEENAHALAEVHSRSRQSFERCQTALQKHFRKLESVADLARMTHLDRAYLARLFDRYIGESPHEVLARLKMNEAAAWLFLGRHTVKEVAAQVGFSDPYHFSRAFKKHYGASPVHFQKMRRSESSRPLFF